MSRGWPDEPRRGRERTSAHERALWHVGRRLPVAHLDHRGRVQMDDCRTRFVPPLKHRAAGEYRDIPTPAFLVEEISAHLKRRVRPSSGHDVLFAPRECGKDITPTASTYGYHWRKAHTAADLNTPDGNPRCIRPAGLQNSSLPSASARAPAAGRRTRISVPSTMPVCPLVPRWSMTSELRTMQFIERLPHDLRDRRRQATPGAKRAHAPSPLANQRPGPHRWSSGTRHRSHAEPACSSAPLVAECRAIARSSRDHTQTPEGARVGYRLRGQADPPENALCMPQRAVRKRSNSLGSSMRSPGFTDIRLYAPRATRSPASPGAGVREGVARTAHAHPGPRIPGGIHRPDPVWARERWELPGWASA